MKMICDRPSFCSSIVVLGAEDDPAAAGPVGLADAVAAADRAAGGEVGAGDDLHQLVELDRRVVDQRDRRRRRPRPGCAAGCSVAMPTAMPPEPLTSRLGNLPGRTRGSWCFSS